MGAAASVNVDHVPGIKEAYEAKKAEGKSFYFSPYCIVTPFPYMEH